MCKVTADRYHFNGRDGDVLEHVTSIDDTVGDKVLDPQNADDDQMLSNGQTYIMPLEGPPGSHRVQTACVGRLIVGTNVFAERNGVLYKTPVEARVGNCFSFSRGSRSQGRWLRQAL
jgi:hypothetical protein